MTTAIPLEINDFDFTIKGDDLLLIGDSLIDNKGLIWHHIESANNFYNNGIKQIITEGFKTEKELINKRTITTEDQEIERIYCKVEYTDVKLKRPSIMHFRTSKESVLYPKVALMREKTYSGSLFISCKITATAYLKDGSKKERVENVNSFKICTVPIIKGSIMCNTHGMSKDALIELGEDPMDPGGYFIVKGGEWAVDCTENMLFNQAKIYINEGYGKSRVRCEYMSKPGDTYQNSDYTLIRFSNDETITIEIARNELNNVQIPFYLLFRAIGWTNDKELINWIVFDKDNDANKDILNHVITAIDAKYTTSNRTTQNYRDVYESIEALKLIVGLIPDENITYFNLAEKPENMHNATNLILKLFDIHCLPHIGMEAKHRKEKLKFLALLIRKTLQVYLKHIPQTDRDSYRNKRIHAAGDNYAKTFKTYFNQAVVLPIKRRILKDFNSAPFSQVNLANMVKSAIYADDFERLIVQTIVSGNKASLKIKKTHIVNRLAAQQLNRKNQLNVVATMRQITATSADSAKQSERASEMRRVNMSSIGYVCVVHSPTEGEKVGINKQLAIFATISPTCSSQVLKHLLASDTDIIPESKLDAVDIFRGQYARVFVNGYLMGYTVDSIELINKYRMKRRKLEIHPYTTIYWDNTQNEVQFFVDNGRLTRPLMIVYNTKRDANVFENKTNEFKQGIAITQDDIIALYKKEKNIDDLLREQKIEYITPEEQENCYICANFDQLRKDSSDEFKEYTHCDIPQAMLGITALTAPFGNHNQCPRITYQTSQAKQTCGYYSLNWPFRTDKETFLQYINETPLIKTLANKYLFPNGCNVMMAIMCYTGFNQEDSLIINKAAIERGLFDGSKFTFVKTDFEQKEEMGNPDASKTDGIKTANYEKLVDGIVQKGQKIKNEDVLIGKYMPTPKTTNDRYVYIDRSIVYKESEEAIVRYTIQDRDNDENKFAKVALRKIRSVVVGDKFSSRAGQKGICAMLLREADMPTTKDGIRPALIFNPHGLPSRMTETPMLEALLGNLCAIKGTHVDGTMFKQTDIESISVELENYGINRYGYERMISGITGEYIDTEIFFGPNFYQRLQKFVVDAEYAVQHALTDAVTMQCLDGAGSQGGLRIGEMERDVLAGHGASLFIHEKFYKHSDGYTEYICRCGKPAIVNHKENLYKCKMCKDNADIVAIPSSWASKLFMQEMESCNVGIRRVPRPFTYEQYDDNKRSLSTIDPYDEYTTKQLVKAAEDMIDDNGVAEGD